MAGRVRKCIGGCGKSQDVTVEAKGAVKGGFSYSPPWMCKECQIKAERQKELERQKKDAAGANPKPEPDKGFTLLPGRPKPEPRKKAAVGGCPPGEPGAAGQRGVGGIDQSEAEAGRATGPAGGAGAEGVAGEGDEALSGEVEGGESQPK
jgi:hypothetical protein